MKVLYIMSSSHMHGSTISLLTLVRGLVECGVDVVVTVMDEKTEVVEILKKLNVKYYVVRVIAHSHATFNGINLLLYPYRMCKQMVIWYTSIKAIRKIARKEKVDIIHTNVSTIHAGHVVAHELGIPHVWHIREYGDLDSGYHLLPSKKAFKRILSQDYTISITEDIRRYNLLEDNKKAYVVYDGVRNRDDIHYDDKKEKYFLCASRVSPEKGHDKVIKAFSHFHTRHPDWSLVIVGEWRKDFYRKLQRMIKKDNLQDCVIFEGFKSNVTDYMRKAKALIVASRYEGLGLMTAEACFAGCIVIGRNTGGTKEILDRTGGILFDNNDQLLEGMEKVVNMPDELYKEKVLHAQKIAQEYFSIESYIKNVHNIYVDIMKERKGGQRLG